VLTDVAQSVTLLAGGALMLAYCVAEAGGLSHVVSRALDEGKMRLDIDASGGGRSMLSVWSFGASLYVINMCVYQDTVQRYCAAKTLRHAQLAVGLTGALALPIWSSFMFLGSALWVLSTQPAGGDLSRPAVVSDGIVAEYALSRLPAGVGGLVLAGVLAAAMSSLDSSFNSVAGIVATDWVQRLYYRGAALSERRLVVVGRLASTSMTVLTVLGALSLQHVEKEGMNDLYNGLQSLTGGASGGLMLLTIFTSAQAPTEAWDRRWHTPLVTGQAAYCAITGSSVVTLGAALCSFGALGESCSLSYYWLLPLSNVAFGLSILMYTFLAQLLHAARRRREPQPTGVHSTHVSITSESVSALGCPGTLEHPHEHPHTDKAEPEGMGVQLLRMRASA
jgi:Na+/proline symporter